MSIKELLIPMTIALLITLALQYYFGRQDAQKAANAVSGQMYEVKHDPAAVAPLVWTIDFAGAEKEKNHEAIATCVDTDYVRYTFTTAGAAITQMECKQWTHHAATLTALNARSDQEKALLVAFAEKTPYWYELVNQEQTADATILTYRSNLPGDARITKTFTVYRHEPKVDLAIALTMSPQTAYIKNMRVFYPSPATESENKLNDVRLFVNDTCSPDSVKLYGKLQEIMHKMWRQPTLFGVAAQFVVHAMISDANTFVFRSAINNVDDRYLLVQLEGAEVKESGTWRLSFYFGPKQLNVMQKVDKRLGDVLDYGMLAPFSRGMLAILNFFYQYVRNYGIAIILLTLLIKLLLLPLSIKGQRGMERHGEFQRKMQYIKQKYRNDPERLKEEQTALLQQQGVGGMTGGCLPLLLQIPVFFALMRVLTNAFEMYHASFLWIPNLSAPDPWYILPILSGLSMLLVKPPSLGGTPSKSSGLPFSTYAWVLVIAAVSIRLSAGIALYIVINQVLTVVQNRIFATKS